MVFDYIAKALRTGGQLPLDAKTYFATLTQLKDLGVANSNPYQYYEWMRVVCAENGIHYVWEEVDQNFTGGVLDSNFQYAPSTISNGIDYSSRYFNFVAVPEGVAGSPIGKPYIIWKAPGNIGDFLEIGDVAEGFFGPNDFRKMVYKGGPLSLNTSWANMEKSNPSSYPQNT